MCTYYGLQREHSPPIIINYRGFSIATLATCWFRLHLGYRTGCWNLVPVNDQTIHDVYLLHSWSVEHVQPYQFWNRSSIQRYLFLVGEGGNANMPSYINGYQYQPCHLSENRRYPGDLNQPGRPKVEERQPGSGWGEAPRRKSAQLQVTKLHISAAISL